MLSLSRYISRFFENIDVWTLSGRGKERYRRILLYLFSAALPRAVGFLAPLITIPLTLSYLGVERFGLWMIIISLLALLGFADLGMGSGLVNALAQANGKNDQGLARRYISSAFFMLLTLAALWALVFVLAYPWLSWEHLFRISDPTAVAEAGPALAVFIACFLVNLPLGVLQRAQLGYQEGHIYNLWEALGKLLALAAVVFVALREMGLPWLVLAFAGAPLIAALMNGVFFFTQKRRWLMPHWSFVQLTVAKQLLGIGMLFLAYNLAYSVGFAADTIILAQVLGSEAVTVYVIPLRLYEIIIVMSIMLSSALWPAYREAIAQGDLAWVKATLVRSIVVTLMLTGTLSGLLIIWGDSILHIWVGPEISIDLAIWIGLGIWVTILASGNVMTTFLYSVNAIRYQAIVMGIFALTAVFLKIIFSNLWAIPGLIGANILAYLLLIILPYVLAVRRIIGRMAPEAGEPHDEEVCFSDGNYDVR